MRVLITGACGWTARAIVAAVVAAGHDAYGFDLSPTCAADTRGLLSHLACGTIVDEEIVDAVVRDVEAIIHLAVAVGEDAYRSARLPFDVNVRGTYNVFDAARRHGIATVVLMSEAAVHLPPDGRQLDARHDWRSSPDADHLYDVTKRLQEDIARDFCATYGMTAVVLRASHIVDGRAQVDATGRPLSELTYCRGGWVCRYDLAAACVRALDLRVPGYSAFHVIGATVARERFDIERTERELGVVCEHRFEQCPPTANVSVSL